jgi:hypothetical protein
VTQRHISSSLDVELSLEQVVRGPSAYRPGQISLKLDIGSLPERYHHIWAWSSVSNYFAKLVALQF